MPKKQRKVLEPVCSNCGKPIDRQAVLQCLKDGMRYDHPECGKTLVRGDMP